jgi:hypothetical protein
MTTECDGPHEAGLRILAPVLSLAKSLGGPASVVFPCLPGRSVRRTFSGRPVDVRIC